MVREVSFSGPGVRQRYVADVPVGPFPTAG